MNVTYESEFLLTDKPGEYTIKVNAVDKASNVANAELTYKVIERTSQSSDGENVTYYRSRT